MREIAALFLLAVIIIGFASLNTVFLWAIGLDGGWKYVEMAAVGIPFGWNCDRIHDWCRQKLARPSPKQPSHGSPR